MCNDTIIIIIITGKYIITNYIRGKREIKKIPLAAPPYTHVIRIFNARANSAATFITCCASSRVGQITKP